MNTIVVPGTSVIAAVAAVHELLVVPRAFYSMALQQRQWSIA